MTSSAFMARGLYGLSCWFSVLLLPAKFCLHASDTLLGFVSLAHGGECILPAVRSTFGCSVEGRGRIEQPGSFATRFARS